MSPDDLDQLLRARRTVRRFAPEHPGRERISAIIAAATTAPSASNHQGWCFFVADDPARIARLAGLVAVVVERVAQQVRPLGRAAFAAYGDYFTRFAAAPVVVVAAYRPAAVLSGLVEPGIADDDRRRIAAMEEHSAILSLGLAVQNLLLMAHAQGLGASCLTGPLLAAPELARDCGVPDRWRLGTLIALGRPAEAPDAPGRKPVAAVLRWLDPEPGTRNDASV